MADATPLLRLYAGRRLRQLARENTMATQQRELLRLVDKAKDTRFGRAHGFAHIGSVDEFQRAVPVRRYDDFWRDYWREPFPHLDNVSWPQRIPMFANSSGTSSGTTKRIPLTRAMMRGNARSAMDLLVHHIANRPQSRILDGKNFMLGSSTRLEQLAPGVQAGDLSGIAASRVPWWARQRYFPVGPAAAIGDWEEKMEVLGRQSLHERIRSIGGTPSWLLLFFERLRALKPQSARLVDWYPHLEMLTHGGVNFAPYRPQFSVLLEGSHAETREVYAASEGFIAVQDCGSGEGLRLIADNGLFFEFVPVDELDAPSPTRHWVANVQKGVNYALVLTTCAGLWSYVIGDTVRFVDISPPRILITGRTSYGLSAFGEHLIGEEIKRGVATAAGAIGVPVIDFMMGPIYPSSSGEPGHHLWLVEFSRDVTPEQTRTFADTLDAELVRLNEDYAAHRANDFGMKRPEIRAVRHGGFAAWMKSRGKLGGQSKVPRVITDPQKFNDAVAAISSQPA